MSNNFNPTEIKKWFVFNKACWWCGKPHWDAFHHIDGRVGKYKNSILNAAPVNNHECHINIHGKLRRKENKKKLLHMTITYLLNQGYEFNETDTQFILKHRNYYFDYAEE